MKRSNCLWAAVALYARRKRAGHPAYLLIRRSRWGLFPHVLYAERRRGVIRVWSFVPLDPTPRRFPPPIFEGRWRWGDK